MINLLTIFVPSLRGGGAERVVLELAAQFANAGICVEIVTVYSSADNQFSIRGDIAITNLGARHVATCVPALTAYLRRRKPSTLLSTLNHANYAAITAARLAGSRTRVILRQATTLSEAARNMKRPFGRMEMIAARMLYPRADAIIAVSDGVAADLTRHRMADPGRLQVIYNPTVTPEVFERAAEPVVHPWLGADIPVMLAVGRLAAAKDYPTLLRAFDRVRHRGVDARLIILGEGPCRERLERLVADRSLRGCVDLPGFVTNPFAYMAQARLFVSSSAWEGLPNVLLQAAALRLPVIATDCPSGPAEIVRETGWGRLVAVGDDLGLADAIVAELLSTPGAARQAPDLTRFMPETVVPQYLSVLGLRAPGVAAPALHVAGDDSARTGA